MTRPIALVLLLALLAPAPLHAQAQPVTVIRDATVLTLGPAGTLERASVVLRGELIEAVGRELPVPAGATVIDGRGKVLTPGLFDPYTQLGLKEVDGVKESVDHDAATSEIGPALDVLDGFNPRSSLIPVNRIEGITRALVAPTLGKARLPLAGRGAVVDLRGALAPRSRWLTRGKVAMFGVLGEAAAEAAGDSRLTSLARLREALNELRSEPGPAVARDALLSALDREALRPVLAGELPLVLTVHRASDIERALDLADEYGLKLVIHGGAEAHLLAGELARRQIPVILDPSHNLPARFEALEARDRAPLLLHQAGVLIAIAQLDDKGTHNSRNLRFLAGNAVARGLPAPVALAAISRNPAIIYGLDGRLGTVEAGKLADLVLWSGDPLETTTAAEKVFIQGTDIPLVSRQTQLRDRYLRRGEAR
ncbi:MAG TPA: amidohydrolase family protein [Nevskiaceae bacterium]|nr:amidohydrolase family protein [Nevskiaceae bacterium]